MEKTLGEIQSLIGGRLVGDATTCIEGVDSLEVAGAGKITFAVPPYLEAARESKAAAILLPEGAGEFPLPAIYVENPRAAFAKLLTLFTPKLEIPLGVSDQAYLGADVKIGTGVKILPFAVVDDHAEIGDNVILYPHSYVGQCAKIGDDTVLYPSVSVREHCVIGKRCIVHSGAVIGSDGFGFTTENGVHTKVPQVGNVVVEDDVEIGAQDGIDRAAMGSTRIGKGTKIDNLVHIGHNCQIGENCLIVAQTGISGSTTVGHNVTFGGQVGTVGHIKIGANSVYAARSGIIGDMPEGYFGAGFPVQPHKDWLKMQAGMRHIAELQKRVKALEKQLQEK